MEDPVSGPINAVGITPEGWLIPINSADVVRGLRLAEIHIGAGQEKWFYENEPVLTACFVGNRGDLGLIHLHGGCWTYPKKGGT